MFVIQRIPIADFVLFSGLTQKEGPISFCYSDNIGEYSVFCMIYHLITSTFLCLFEIAVVGSRLVGGTEVTALLDTLFVYYVR